MQRRRALAVAGAVAATSLSGGIALAAVTSAFSRPVPTGQAQPEKAISAVSNYGEAQPQVVTTYVDVPEQASEAGGSEFAPAPLPQSGAPAHQPARDVGP